MTETASFVWIGDPERRPTIQDVVDVARGSAKVRIHPDAALRVALCREAVEKLVANGVKVYGITTGFASLRRRPLRPEEAEQLSRNLIRSHSVGFGRPFPEDIVRASMFLRAATLARGESGVRLGLLRRLVAMLNARVYPYVPDQGSLGSSGDLAPLSHVFLVLMGDEQARVHWRLTGERPVSTSDRYVADADLSRSARREDVMEAEAANFVALDLAAQEKLGAKIRCEVADDGLGAYDAETVAGTYKFKHKEGLACNNGAVFTAAIAALACHDAARLLASADLVAALSFEALQAVHDCIDERVVEMRPHPGHVRSAKLLRTALETSELVRPQAAVGLNMARLNMTICVLHKKHRDDPEAAKLMDVMRECQKNIRAEITKSRAKAPPEQYAYAKAAEAYACGDAFAPVLDAWKALGSKSREKFAEEFDRGIVTPEDNPEVQDNYSFRAAATVSGVARETLDRAWRVVELEIDATTDNPVISLKDMIRELKFPESGLPTVEAFRQKLNEGGKWTVAANAVLSAANFHGEPIGVVLDQLAAVVAEVGNIAERRVAVLTDKNHSKGLPSYLSWDAGVNSGFMMPQYTAAALVMENRHLAAPASVDSVPTGEMSEDHVANSTYAARKCVQVILNTERIIGIELLNAYQGVQFRKPAKLGALTGKVEQLVRNRVGDLFLHLSGRDETEFLKRLADLGLGPAAVADIAPCVIDDVVLYPLMEACAALVRRGEVAALVPAMLSKPL